MKHPLVFCLHGFLGQPSDWTFLNENGQDLYEYVFVDFSKEASLDPSQSLANWGAQFNQYALSFGADRVRHIVGYSLGGRLALHALQNRPEMWSKAIFISTHVGLSAEEQKTKRLKSDSMFAKKVEKANWQQVLSDWNSQFQDGQKEPARQETIYQRKLLSAALTNWSLGFQYNFRESVSHWPVKQLWLAGEQDPRYLEILEEIPAAPFLKKEVIPQSSHRILFEQPNVLKSKIESFLE